MTTTHQVESVARPIPPEAVTALAAAIAGPVLDPGDPGFAAETGSALKPGSALEPGSAGATAGAGSARRPVLAIGVTGPDDVRAAVRFAAEHGQPVAVLAPGHHGEPPAGAAVLINTSRMTGLSIDEEWMTARIEAGVRWQQVIDAAARISLAPMAGSALTAGAVAYHLGGGLSPVLGRPLGFAADYVRSLDVVTADGRLRQVSADQEPELFWALRGGGENLGVVTALEFELFPVRIVYGGELVFDGRDAAAVLDAYRSWVPQLPDQLSSSIVFRRSLDRAELPVALRDRPMLELRIAYLGSATYGEELLAPMRAAAPALVDQVGERPFSAIAALHTDPAGLGAGRERAVLLRDLSEDVVDRLVDLAAPDSATGRGTGTAVELRHLGGALSRGPRVENAVDNRDAGFCLVGADIAGPQRVRPGYEPHTNQRLLRVKRAYDPRNLFLADRDSGAEA